MRLKFKNIFPAIGAVIIMAASMPSFARTLEVKAGDIASGKIKTDLAAGETLVLKGTLDASDLFALGNIAGLKNLDLGDAEICAYKGDALRGRHNYPASSIPAGAFSGSPAESIVLPNGLKHIGDAAFAASSLVSISIPAGVDSIGFGAFAHCAALKEATLENSLAGESMFEGCKALTKFTPSDGLLSLSARSFASTGLKDLDLSSCKNLLKIGDEAFAGCQALESVSLPARASYSFGNAVFFNCTSLVSVSGLRLASLPPLTFANDRRLASHKDILDRTDGSIGDFAMVNNSSMPVSITLPETLTALGERAMAGCTSLKEINVTALHSVPETGEKVWGGITQGEVKLLVSKQNRRLFSDAPQWQDFDISTPLSGVSDIELGFTASITDGILGILSLSPGSEIALYSADGREIFRGKSPAGGNFSARVNVSPGEICILSVTTAEGIAHVVKLPAG